MPFLSRLRSWWQVRHGAMLEVEKERLGFPGPSSVLRHYNSFTSYFRVRAGWEYAGCKPGDRVLIVGDAGGKDYWYYSWKGIESDVVDVAPQVIIPKVKVWDISGEELPFERGTFDVVIMCDVLEHLYEDSRALANVRDLLKDSGVFMISGPYWHDDPEYHVRIHSPRIIVRMLEHHGFKVEKMTSRGFAVNFYRVVHPLILMMHYAWYRLTGRIDIIGFNERLYRAVLKVQGWSRAPAVDRVLFGSRGGLNGYIIRAARGDEKKYDAALANRLAFADKGMPDG